MDKIRCAHCRCLFVPNHRIKNQRYCNKKECQRARKNAWQRQKLANDPDYKANQRVPEELVRTKPRLLAKMDASAQKVFLISSA